jgi:hypothetical protein
LPELQTFLKSAALSALFLWALQGCIAHTTPAPINASLSLLAARLVRWFFVMESARKEVAFHNQLK